MAPDLVTRRGTQVLEKTLGNSPGIKLHQIRIHLARANPSVTVAFRKQGLVVRMRHLPREPALTRFTRIHWCQRLIIQLKPCLHTRSVMFTPRQPYPGIFLACVCTFTNQGNR